MKLNIYKKENGKKVVAKTYEAETYDLMYGTVEDFLQLIDVQNIQMVIGETVEENQIIGVAEIVTNCFGQIAPLLMDVFDGLTSEELRNTKVSEIIDVVKECISYSVKTAFKGTSKNAQREA